MFSNKFAPIFVILMSGLTIEGKGVRRQNETTVCQSGEAVNYLKIESINANPVSNGMNNFGSTIGCVRITCNETCKWSSECTAKRFGPNVYVGGVKMVSSETNNKNEYDVAPLVVPTVCAVANRTVFRLVLLCCNSTTLINNCSATQNFTTLPINIASNKENKILSQASVRDKKLLNATICQYTEIDHQCKQQNEQNQDSKTPSNKNEANSNQKSQNNIPAKGKGGQVGLAGLGGLGGLAGLAGLAGLVIRAPLSKQTNISTNGSSTTTASMTSTSTTSTGTSGMTTASTMTTSMSTSTAMTTSTSPTTPTTTTTPPVYCPAPPIVSQLSCQGNTNPQKIQCAPNEYIHIVKAMFGRWDNTTCGSFSDVGCSDNTAIVTKNAIGWCEGLNNQVIYVDPIWYPAPPFISCPPGVPMVMVTQWQCQPKLC